MCERLLNDCLPGHQKPPRAACPSCPVAFSVGSQLSLATMQAGCSSRLVTPDMFADIPFLCAAPLALPLYRMKHAGSGKALPPKCLLCAGSLTN